MPELRRFLGIVIYMCFRDRAPAHFHAEYGEFEVVVNIATGEVSGKFPPRAQRLILEWCVLYIGASCWKTGRGRFVKSL